MIGKRFPGQLTAALVLLLVSTLARAYPPYSDLIVFGDSLSDIGNTSILDGDGTPQVPSPSWYPDTGRYTDGDVWVEILWRDLGLPGALQPSLAGGTDFASGGARSRYEGADTITVEGVAVPPPAGTPTADDPSPGSFLGQVGLYLSNTGGVADPDALYTIWIGANDVRDQGLVTALQGFEPALLLFAQSLSDLTSGIGRLIAAGARHLLIPTVSDVGLTPEAQASGLGELLSYWTAAYNATLNRVLDAYGHIPGVEIRRIDTVSALHRVLADPSAYGIVNTTDPCLAGYSVDDRTADSVTLCTSPETYVFYDVVHPTSTMHALLAEEAYGAVASREPHWPVGASASARSSAQGLAGPH